MLTAVSSAAGATRDGPVRLLSKLRVRSAAGLIFVLLVATLVLNAMPSSPLPLGPHVTLGRITVMLLAGYVLWRAAPLRKPWAIVSHVVGEFQPVFPIIAVSTALMVWALTVYLLTDTLHLARLSQMALGIGVLAGVYFSVDTVHRAVVMLLALVGATVGVHAVRTGGVGSGRAFPDCLAVRRDGEGEDVAHGLDQWQDSGADGGHDCVQL